VVEARSNNAADVGIVIYSVIITTLTVSVGHPFSAFFDEVTKFVGRSNWPELSVAVRTVQLENKRRGFPPPTPRAAYSTPPSQFAREPRWPLSWL
jgi:hypothetical protein